MFDEKKSLEMIEGFQAHYDYDTSYMKEMLTQNPKAYETFEAFLPMAGVTSESNKDVLYVVKLATIKNEDCGACLQLTVDMAIEAGVDKKIIHEIVFNEGEELVSDLKDVYDFTLAVANNYTPDAILYDTLNKRYSKALMVEIALVLASMKVFPTVKRVLNVFQSCSSIQIKV